MEESARVERFIPSAALAVEHYSSYHHVLLDSEQKHSFSEVAARYQRFFHSLKDHRRRRITFLNFDYNILSMLSNIPYFNPHTPSVEGFYCQFNDGTLGNKINSIIFQAPHFSQGLKNVLGFNSKHRQATNLAETISFT